MKLVTLTVPILATLALAACGGDGTQNAGTGKPDDQAELAFARCMRAAGIDFPDPAAPGSGPQRVRIGKGTAPQKLGEATETCRKKTGGGPQPLTDEQQAGFRDAALRFAQCMRRNGVNIPDPRTDSGEAGIRITRGSGRGSGPDIEAPAFKRANDACQKLLPGAKGGPGSGPSFSLRAK